MELNKKTEELKKIFKFLAAGKEDNNGNSKRKTEDIFYGLDHYGLKMEEKKKNDLKNALIDKTDNDGNIEFEDFKDCFDLKKKDKKIKTDEIENSAQQIFFLIQEILGIKEQKLSQKNVKQIFEIVFCLDEVEHNNDNIPINLGFNTNKNEAKIEKSILNNDKAHLINNSSKVFKSIRKDNKNTPTPVDKEEDFAIKLKKEFSDKENLAKMLIDCIDLDGDGFISLSDFEFLIKNYFDYSSKK